MNKFKNFLIIKGLSTVTVNGHLQGIKRILKQLGTKYPNEYQCQEFVVNLYTSDYSYSHKVNQVRTLEYWLEHIGTPIKFGRQRKPKRLLKETLNESEINRLIRAASTKKQHTIITFLAYSSLRPKELCSVRVRDINFGLNQLHIQQGKGYKDNIIYLPAKCVETVLEYVIQTNRNSDDYLFQTYQGNQYNPQALRKLVKTLAKKASIKKRVYPYLLRHSFATNSVKRGANILWLKNHMRHSFVETTMWYVHSTGTQEMNEQYLPQYI